MTVEQKKRIGLVCLLALILMGILGGYAFFCLKTGWGIPCLFHLLTGLDCGFCGLTRAAVSVLQGDLLTSFSYHVLWPLYAAYLLWVAVSDAAVYIRQGKVQLLPASLWIHAVFLAVTVGYGILRNLL